MISFKSERIIIQIQDSEHGEQLAKFENMLPGWNHIDLQGEISDIGEESGQFAGVSKGDDSSVEESQLSEMSHVHDLFPDFVESHEFDSAVESVRLDQSMFV